MVDPTAIHSLKIAAEQFGIQSIKKIFDAASEKILSKTKIEEGSRKLLDKTLVHLRSGFNDFLKTSFNRCNKFKSILSNDVSLSLIENYIHVSLTCGVDVLSDIDLIKQIEERKCIVVTGLAGSGKSMFMRYLAVDRFVKPNGRIPLFVDLRSINKVSKSNLLGFIRGYSSSSSNTITESQFEIALRSGFIDLILDGFDEINYDSRDEIESQILNINKNFPETCIVVSSRPDPRFGGWSCFNVFRVNELSKTQSLKLIKGLPYDSGVKNRFLKAVNDKLYDNHKSFLSSPLLTTIMLLTYEQFAEIPDKMYSFYRQAFDTLFQKHDAQKEQFQRKTHTGLAREDFSACFSAFCAMSYLEQRFSFDEQNLMSTADKAIKYARSNNSNIKKTVTAKQFVDDLISSVCMLHNDGLDVAFVHRSFQEYFTSVFVVETHGEKTKRLLDQLCHRFNDSVIEMATEMDREGVEQVWVIPTIDFLEKTLFNVISNNNSSIGEIYSKIVGTIICRFDRSEYAFALTPASMEIVGKIGTIIKLYPKQTRSLEFPLLNRIPMSKIEKLIHSTKNGECQVVDKLREFYDEIKKMREKKISNIKILTIKPGKKDDFWLKSIGVSEMFDKMQISFSLIRKEIKAREKRKNSILDDFF